MANKSVYARKPRLLDLFCGAGGAAMGYHRAGFEVVGVDIKPQPHFPFEFHQADALMFPLGDFDAIHASPPCQDYSSLRSCLTREFPRLIAVVRQRLESYALSMAPISTPWVIENVMGAVHQKEIRPDIVLCAHSFGLRSYRHRAFESNFSLKPYPHKEHGPKVNRRKMNRRGHWDAGGYVTVVGDIGSYVGPEAMGIDWMTGRELSEAIPPQYTEWIGSQLLKLIEENAA